VTNEVYDQYGEVHGGSVGETMCGEGEVCKGPNPDRIMEGNSYFGMVYIYMLLTVQNVLMLFRQSHCL
jgi:hypothetical protein